MAELFDTGIFSVEDTDGSVGAGWKLNFYVTGTSTRQNTYPTEADANAGTNANANPVVADASGRFAAMWLATSANNYKAVLTDENDVVKVTKDPAVTGFSASGGSSRVGFLQAGTGAVARTVQSRLRDSINVKDFGAAGDGIVDDGAAIILGIAACQSQQRELYFPPGIYKWSASIPLSGQPIGFVGAPFAPTHQGSQRPSATLRWTGGGSPMFTAASSGWMFTGFGVENFGSATDFLEVTNGQRFIFRQMSFITNGGGGSQPGRFSRSIFHSTGNNYGYSRFEDMLTTGGAAPKFLFIDGNGAANGCTPISILGKSLFESGSDGDMTVAHLKDITLDALILLGGTFNQQSNKLKVVDTTEAPNSETITSLVVDGIEIDVVASVAADRMFKLTNVRNASINRNIMQCGGTMTGLIDLVSSTITSCVGNYWERIAGDLISCDADSRVWEGVNYPNVATVQKLTNNIACGRVKYTQTAGGTVTLQGHRIPRSGGVFEITITQAGAWTLSFGHYGDNGTGYFTDGQTLQIQFRNTIGGGTASTAPTLDGGATYWKLDGGAMPAVADAKNRTVTLRWNGADRKFYECSGRGPELDN